MSEAGKAHLLSKKEQRSANHTYHERKLAMQTKEALCALLAPRFWSVRIDRGVQVPALLRRRPLEIPVAYADGRRCFINPDVKVRTK